MRKFIQTRVPIGFVSSYQVIINCFSWKVHEISTCSRSFFQIYVEQQRQRLTISNTLYAAEELLKGIIELLRIIETKIAYNFEIQKYIELFRIGTIVWFRG